MKVFVTRRLPGGALDRLAAAHDVEVWPEQMPPGREELLARAPDLDGLLSLLTDPVDAELIAVAPRLKAISNYAVGVDNVDLEAAAARGIPVGNTPDVLTDTTADLAVALMLGISRRLEGFGCEILHTSRRGGVRFDELLERSEFVTLHCPLTAETRGLIGDEALARMQPTAYLVNTARGPIVDSEALARALRAGRIAGAALDVTDPEPIPGGHPLLDAPNLLVLPHLGSATEATRARMADMAVDNLLAGLAGEPMPHSVT